MEIMFKVYLDWIVGGSVVYDLVDGIFYGDVIKEVNCLGEVVWLWKFWEYFVIEDFLVYLIFDCYYWFLINGFGVICFGEILMSFCIMFGVIWVDC